MSPSPVPTPCALCGGLPVEHSYGTGLTTIYCNSEDCCVVAVGGWEGWAALNAAISAKVEEARREWEAGQAEYMAQVGDLLIENVNRMRAERDAAIEATAPLVEALREVMKYHHAEGCNTPDEDIYDDEDYPCNCAKRFAFKALAPHTQTTETK